MTGRGGAITLAYFVLDCLVLGCFVLGGLLHWLWVRRCRRQPVAAAAHGSARFATRKRDLHGLLGDLSGNVPPGAVLLGTWKGLLFRRPVVLSRPRALQHGIIVGGSGTGKSFSFFLPNARAAAGNASVVCTDPKSELWRHTARFHTRVLRFAPGEPDRSNSNTPFNLIPLCRDARLAELAARAFVESGNTQRTEQVWLDVEAAYLGALFSHTATLAEPTLVTAYRLLTTQSQKTLTAQMENSASPVAREQATVLGETTDRMRGSIVPALAARLQFLRDPVLCRFVSGSFAPPDFSRLRTTPTAVYWCLREQDIVRLRPLTSVFFTLLLEQLIASSSAKPEGKQEALAVPAAPAVPVTVLLDEFATVMGSVPQFDTTIALARGRDLALWLGVQSLAQLETCYGKASAQVILTNCATKIALSGLDVDTATYFSRSLGEASVSRRQVSWNRRRFALLASSSSVSHPEHARRLLTPDEVRRIGEKDALVITGNRRPFLLQKYWYHANAQAPQMPQQAETREAEVPAKERVTPRQSRSRGRQPISGRSPIPPITTQNKGLR